MPEQTNDLLSDQSKFPLQVRSCFSAIDQEQLAAQIVALMNAHFQRPTVEEKQQILALAAGQIKDEKEQGRLAQQRLSGSAIQESL